MDYEYFSDELLAEVVKIGNLSAFDQLYSRHESTVKKAILGTGARQDDVDDISQLTWMIIREKVSRYSNYGNGSFSWWMKAIARNCSKAYYRSRLCIKETAIADGFEPHADTKSPSEMVVQQEIQVKVQVKVREALERLSPEYREILTLRFLEELSQQEIAVTLGIEVTTCYWRLHRAKVALRNRLTKSEYSAT